MRNRRHKIFKAIVVTTAMVLFAGSVLAAPADDLATAKSLGRTFTAVAHKAGPGVVSIRVERFVETPAEGSGGFLPFRREKQKGQGSGFVVDHDGHILTNHHVVGVADKIEVLFHDGRLMRATLLGSDPQSDVALLHVAAEHLHPLELADSDAVEVGEWVVAIGTPFGLTQTVTTGIVSAKGRNSVGIADYENFIQTDAAINPGNSGGPLLNLDGQVVGINTAIMSRIGGSHGIGFAIPANLARSVMQQLRASGKVVRGYLGVVIQNMSPDLAAAFQVSALEGALVSQVSPHSPAAKAGLVQGDVIVAVGSKEVANLGALRNVVGLLTPGTKTDLTVLRGGKQKTLTVTIGSLEQARTQDGSARAARLGLQLAPLDEERAAKLGSRAAKGALISTVKPDSAAAAAGLRPGEVIVSVNRKSIYGVDAFYREVAAAKDTGKLLLRVRSGRHARYVVLHLA
ncbi:MAG: DegQ family serine endoprotease [Planctomycetota bacterium]|nr:DegQ family serine endoprotease [Planctomycetota bacterium]